MTIYIPVRYERDTRTEQGNKCTPFPVCGWFGYINQHIENSKHEYFRFWILQFHQKLNLGLSFSQSKFVCVQLKTWEKLTNTI